MLFAGTPRHAIAIAGLGFMLLGGCESETTTPTEDLVTVSGIVRNIDTAGPAVGVRVTLYGTGYRDAVRTGDDGAYSLEVPRGSTLLLYVDDFDPEDDVWIPFLNVEVPPIIADGDLTTHPIHGCPHSACPDEGTVALFDRYLADFDDDAGDFFVPGSISESGGSIGGLIGALDTTMGVQRADGFVVTSSSGAFPSGYSSVDPEVDLCVEDMVIFTTMSQANGMALSFGDPGFSGSSVTWEITHVDDEALGWATFEIPVAPGMFTLMWLMNVDGVNVNFREWACTVGLITGNECEGL